MFNLKIITPEETKYNGNAHYLKLPGFLGEMGVLPKHAPLFSILNPGTMFVRSDTGEFSVNIGKGYVKVTPNEAVVMVSSACDISDIRNVSDVNECNQPVKG